MHADEGTREKVCVFILHSNMFAHTMAYAYFNTLEDMHLLNILIWYALLGRLNMDIQKQAWVYQRNQQYFLEFLQYGQ